MARPTSLRVNAPSPSAGPGAGQAQAPPRSGTVSRVGLRVAGRGRRSWVADGRRGATAGLSPIPTRAAAPLGDGPVEGCPNRNEGEREMFHVNPSRWVDAPPPAR
ncbi:hypothetical protein GCM10009832_33130 [Dietzia kunjamensis subsp. schimae]